MYLNDLMQGEKFAFYSIVKHLVSIDGEFSIEEKNMMEEFLQEMKLSKDQIPEISPKDALDMLSFSTFATRKKIYIELIGVTLCDESLHADEKALMDKIAGDFLIDEKLQEELFTVVKDVFLSMPELDKIRQGAVMYQRPVRRCEYCGAQVNEGQNFCIGCGAPV